MAVSIARKIAYDALLRVEAQSFLRERRAAFRTQRRSKTSDAALATEITMGVLRWLCYSMTRLSRC